MPLSLLFAIPDHPWVENTDGAAVRIAMTVAALQRRDAAATLQTITAETEGADGAVEVTLATRCGTINADLTIGADVASAIALKANEGISNRGVQVIGSGFIVTRDETAALGLGRIPGLEHHIREYRNGKDLTSRPRDVLVIDLFGLTEVEVRERFPEVYQWVYQRVKPERDANNRDSYRLNWWIHGEPRKAFRPALDGLPRYIATVETSKHRFFQFLDASVLPDNRLVCVAHDDAYVLGVLSSRIHVAWALATGGTLEDRPVYNKTRCFETFPFPDATEAQKACIRDLTERLDAHRKRQLALHPTLTMTDLYNVLSRCDTGASPVVPCGTGAPPMKFTGEAPVTPTPLTPKQRTIHEQGLITVLRQLHDELDAAVATAYGWGEKEDAHRSSLEKRKKAQHPAPNIQRSRLSWEERGEDGGKSIPNEEILERLVALNRVRTEEEARGLIRYLRPSYQRPATAPTQSDLSLSSSVLRHPSSDFSPSPLLWPETLADQIALVRGVIRQTAWQPIDGIKALCRCFSGVRTPTVQRLVDALAALGQVG